MSEPAYREEGAPPPVRLVEPHAPDGLVDSYRRLADVFHGILSEENLDDVLERIADTLAEIVPYDTLTIFEADVARRVLRPVMARDQWADEIMKMRPRFGEGITGWAVEHRQPVLVQQAHRDPRVKFVPGTPPDEPEALISVPLVARGAIKGALAFYRLGEGIGFSEDEFELAQRFADAAALALDNAQIRAHLEHLATTDSLTGLLNHRSFHERLRTELRGASRTGGSVALLMLDLDDFKRVNDIYGHGVGDEVLREIAAALRKTVREADAACRLGGEEFAVILSPSTADDAHRLAGRLTALVAALDVGPAGPVSVSLGIAVGPGHAMNSRELVACAEAAMMTAKARGKNRIVLYGDEASERPQEPAPARDVRSLAQMKLLQSVSGKLGRLNGVREIGTAIADELRSLIDYHNCRVFVVEGENVVPIAFRGDLGGDVLPDALACRLGQGITGHVALTVESVLTGDAVRCELAERIPGTDAIEESLIAVPLPYGGKAIGVVVISKLGIDQFDEDDVRLLEVLAGHAAVALENARLYEAQRREAECATALLEFSRELSRTTGLDETLERIVERSASLLGAAGTSVWLEDAASGALVREAQAGEGVRELPAAVGRDFLRELDKPVQIDDVAIAAIELGDRGGCIAARTGGELAARELRLLGGVAHQAKLAIANAGAFQRLEETFFSTVEALANALEASDEYTSSHARWITDMSIRLGARLGLDGASLKRLELGALFHDIGKIGIPTSILSKPGRLTAEERRIIETHPELGERIIAPIDLLNDVCPIVRHCHERYDGAGYPDRKAGDDIPLESRIILVCDAFHAMTTDRPYRKRLSAAEACRRLEQGAGTQFDPVVVDACLELLRSSALDPPG